MTSPSSPDWSVRIGRARSAIEALSVDAAVVSAPANIRYLTGFAATAGLLVVGRDGVWLLADGRYDRTARAGARAGTMFPAGIRTVSGSYANALAEHLDERGFLRVAFESAHVTVATLASWQDRAAAVVWARSDRLVEGLRLIKDDHERAVFRRAGRLLTEVASGLSSLVAGGRTEIEVARSIDRALEHIGFSGPAFPTIVASGPASASPHARPTTRRLESGDLVVLDFGGVLDGYCVDLTRMASVGPPGRRVEHLFLAVRDAQAAALEAIKAGVAGTAVDGAARRVLGERGLADAFLHATGHGLGLDVHEAPRLGRAASQETPDVLADGMVCTVEPGAYVEGLGGVRIEDDVLVTPSGYEALTTAPKDLLVV